MRLTFAALNRVLDECSRALDQSRVVTLPNGERAIEMPDVTMKRGARRPALRLVKKIDLAK
jgi:hypothetical protein